MFFSKNKLNCLKIGLTAIFTLSSLFSIRADDNEKLAAHHHFNQPKPKNLFIEWNAGATNFDFHAEATMTIFNNDTRTPLSPGEFVDGVFVPAWRIYFNQPYTTAPSETRVTVAESDITLNYFVMTPNESFGTIPPGGSITLNMETGFSNAVISHQQTNFP